MRHLGAGSEKRWKRPSKPRALQARAHLDGLWRRAASTPPLAACWSGLTLIISDSAEPRILVAMSIAGWSVQELRHGLCNYVAGDPDFGPPPSLELGSTVG